MTNTATYAELLVMIAERDAALETVNAELYAIRRSREQEQAWTEVLHDLQEAQKTIAELTKRESVQDFDMARLHCEIAELRKTVAAGANIFVENIRQCVVELKNYWASNQGDVPFNLTRYFEHADVLISAYDELSRDNARWINARDVWTAEMEAQRQLAENLKLQAQTHAQEARTANATIAEIYQACTAGTGEPGTWHGAQPVIKALAGYETQERQLREALSDLLLIFYRPRDEVLPGGLSYDLCIDVVQKACSALALPEQKETLRQSVDRMRAELKSLGFDGSKIDINQDSGNG